MTTGRDVLGVIALAWGSVQDFDDDAVQTQSTIASYVAHALDRVQLLEERHRVATTLQAAMLTELPGVGRKTANVVLGNAFDLQEGIVVDTHVARLSERLGLTRETKPEKIEADLTKLIPRQDWAMFSHWIIWHGRRRCFARRPQCDNCEVRDLCPSRDLKG